MYFLSTHRPRQRAHECRGLVLLCRCAASAQVVDGGVFDVGCLVGDVGVGRAGILTKEETHSVTAVVCKPKTRAHARICCRRVYVSLGRAHAHGAFGISRTLRWRSVQHVRRRFVVKYVCVMPQSDPTEEVHGTRTG